jgi:uncharacterized protein
MSELVSELCRRCGLCCDGTLFTQVPLAPAEAEALCGRVGTRVEADGSQVLPQRCGALHGEGCGVYAERPAVCRAFRCLLLTAAQEGEVSAQEALRLIAEAHRRLEALEQALPSQPGAAGGSVVRRARRVPALRAPLGELERFVERHFRGRHGQR